MPELLNGSRSIAIMGDPFCRLYFVKTVFLMSTGGEETGTNSNIEGM